MGAELRTGLTSAHLVQLAFPALQDLPLLAPLPESSSTQLIVAPEVALRKLPATNGAVAARTDRKSTRLNSSHLGISYAVFCLQKTRSSPSATCPAVSAGIARRRAPPSPRE